MIIEKLEVGPLAVNCYLVGDEGSRAGMIIDPGADADAILNRLKALKLDIRSIVLTHAHFDHVGALKEVKDATGAEVAVHSGDARLLRMKDPLGLAFGLAFGLPGSPPPAPDRLLEEGNCLDIGKEHFRVLHTPGHTPGGICLLGEGTIFTGDTLFNTGIGRTDLPGGDNVRLMSSIHDKIMALPDDTAVYPGHGPDSTVGRERRGNPFLQDY